MWYFLYKRTIEILPLPFEQKLSIKMHLLVGVLACCISLIQARPGIGGHGELHGVPDLESYSKIGYPKYDLIELGEYSKGLLPPKTILSTQHITVKIPKPYPVKVPHNVPYPVPVAKPYPVVQTKIVKVPHPVPVEVIKKVPYPIEVPKPYPVPHEEYHGGGGSGSGSGGSYGDHFEGGDGGYQNLSQDYGGHQQQVSYESSSYQSQSYGGGGEDHGEEDRSVGYPAVQPAQAEQQQVQEQQEQH